MKLKLVSLLGLVMSMNSVLASNGIVISNTVGVEVENSYFNYTPGSEDGIAYVDLYYYNPGSSGEGGDAPSFERTERHLVAGMSYKHISGNNVSGNLLKPLSQNSGMIMTSDRTSPISGEVVYQDANGNETVCARWEPRRVMGDWFFKKKTIYVLNSTGYCVISRKTIVKNNRFGEPTESSQLVLTIK